MIGWDELRYVLAVSGAGSITEAARAIGVDKATVSRRIAALERSVGVRLVDRTPDGYRLTTYGERVVVAAAEMSRAAEALEAELSEVRGERGGVVHLSVPQFFASRVLFAGLGPFRAAHPHIELVVNASSAVLNVAQRQAEVGLRNVRPTQRSVTVKRVGFLGSALYGSKRYLEKNGRPKRPDDLGKHTLLGWDRELTYVSAFRWLGRTGARVALRVNDAAVLSDAVAEGIGLAVLPCVLGDEHDRLVRIDELGVGRDAIFAVAPGELRATARVRAVLDLLTDVWRTNAARLSGRT